MTGLGRGSVAVGACLKVGRRTSSLCAKVGGSLAGRQCKPVLIIITGFGTLQRLIRHSHTRNLLSSHVEQQDGGENLRVEYRANHGLCDPC